MTNTLSLPTFHSKVLGDTETLNKQLTKKGLTKIVNTAAGYHEVINTDDLIPLESQRNAKTSWIAKALRLGNGFDSIAAGIIQVARDPSGKNYVWDGCGRLALAQQCNIPALNCWVTEITAQEAAHYFVYTQKTSNRSLKPGELYINAYEHGIPEAVEFAEVLKRLGVRIQGAEDYWVPRVSLADRSNYPQVKERSVKQALKFAKQNEATVRYARDTIVQAGWEDDEIRQDLLPGLVIFYMCYPEAMKNGLGKAVRSFLKSIAGTVTQGKLDFKHKGGNLHNKEAESVALGFVKAFRSSPALKASMNPVVTEKRMKQYLAALDNVEYVEEEDTAE
jgi:hypothetical protein